MLTIDSNRSGALAAQLAKVDAAQQDVLNAMDALERAVGTADEPTQMACAQALSAANAAYDGALIDMVESVRTALYGPAEDP